MKISEYVLAARRALFIAAAADGISLLALAGGRVSHGNFGVLVILAAPVFVLIDLRPDSSWVLDSWMFFPLTALLLFPWYWVFGFFLCLLWFSTGRTRMASNRTVEPDARKDSARGSP